MSECKHNERQGGIGLVVHDEAGNFVEQMSMKVLEVTDNAELELCALVEALEHAQDGDTIYSNSAFCVNGFNSWLDNWKAKGWRKSNRKPVANRQLWQQVDELRSTKYVEVHQVSRNDLFRAVEFAKECVTGRKY